MDASSARAVFAKFSGTEILEEQGRLLFSLLNAFGVSGYSVHLFDDLPEEKLGKYGLMARSLPNVALTTTVPPGGAEMLYVFDHEDRGIGRRRWRKKVRVGFDIFSRFWLRRPVLMPFPVHPVHARGFGERLEALRSNRRNIRVLFSGEMTGYTSNRITYPGPKLPRADVVNTIRDRLGERVVFVQDDAVLDRTLACPYYQGCVIVDTGKLRIPEQRWLETLAKVDFFLSPPGIVMPMCHNAVEALSVGSIPIINYAEWFSPALRHMENCIVFEGQDDLVAKMLSVLSMEEDAIAAMRRRAISYYDSHLSARAFTTALESRTESTTDLLMIREEYVRRNAHRLNGRSALIRG